MHSVSHRCAWVRTGAGALLAASLSLVAPSIGHSEQAIEVVLSFPGAPDGADPRSGVAVGKSSKLYGVTFGGGEKEDSDGRGVGTVFSLTSDATHETLYKGSTLFKFTDNPSVDSGHFPVGGVVIGKNGNLYGVTRNHWDGRGRDGGGTIYALKPPSSASQAWDHNVLYSFRDAPAGTPSAGLVIGNDGALYGTTSEGGSDCGGGTVFRFRPNGTATGGSYRDIHRFRSLSDSPDCPKPPSRNNGMRPSGRLTVGKDGVLYGTTAFGGLRTGQGGSNGQGCGTVFSLTPPVNVNTEWSLSVLIRFLCVENGKGETPEASVFLGADGSLYGTTKNGGISPDISHRGNGIVFQLTPPDPVTGKREPKNLWRFTGGLGGDSPAGGVIATCTCELYGTTEKGGRHNNGTLFRLVRQPSGWWKHEVLYHFGDGGEFDAAYPSGDLLLHERTLIGTTSGGGASGAGTVYRWQLGPD